MDVARKMATNVLPCYLHLAFWDFSQAPNTVFMPKAAFLSSPLCFLAHRFEVGSTAMDESWKLEVRKEFPWEDKQLLY